MPYNTFPNITLTGYSGIGNNGPNTTTHVGQTANVTLSRLMGNHSLKAGVDYRRIVADAMVYGSSAGAFTFNQGFTQGPTPTTASSAAGDSIASFLLGYPASGEINVGTPASYFINYYSAYIQDDYRVSPSLTLNMGLRYEYEPGVGEKDDRFTVGFDREAPFPIQVPGLDLKGGLMYAGVDGYPTTQGHTLNGFAPRGGFAWSVTDRTVIRGGYGLFWSPGQIPGVGESAIGARGYSAVDDLPGEHGRQPHAGRIDFRSVPERRHATAGQLARPADRRRRRDRLRRSELEARLRPAVLGRPAA